MDAGALGKKIQEEILTRHGVNLEAAEKSRKVEFIELLNDDLRTAKFKAFKGSLFEEDCMLLQWDKESKIRNPDRPKISDTYHSDACFVPGSPVITDQGIKNIEDIQIGDKVLTHKGNFKSVTNTMSKQFSGDIISLNIAGIKSPIECTPNHSFYAKPSKKNHKGTNTGQRILLDPEWTAANSLESTDSSKKNHYLIIPEAQSTIECDFSNEFCFLIGYYMAEGSLGGNGSQVSFACHTKEINVKTILQKAIENEYPKERFADSPSTQHRRRNNICGPRLRGSFSTRSLQGTNSSLNSVGIKELHEYLKSCGKSDYKTFPKDIINFNEEQAAYCIAGYLMGDGHFASTGIKSSSISKNLNAGLKILYSKLKIGPSECTLKRGYEAYICSDKLSISKPQYSLTLSKEDSLKIINFIDSQELLKSTFTSKLINIPKVKNQKNFNSLNKRLKSTCKKPYNGIVYNLEVEDDESYTIDGIAVHNCDAVLYAWRECKHFLAEATKHATKFNTAAYMEELEQKEAEKMHNKLHNPFADYEEMIDEMADDDFSDIF